MQCGWTDFMSAMMVWCAGNPLSLISPHPSASSPSFHSLPGCYISTSRDTNAWRHIYKPTPRCNMTKTKACTGHSFPICAAFIRLGLDASCCRAASMQRVHLIFDKACFSQQSWNLCRFNLFWLIIQLNFAKLRPPKKICTEGARDFFDMWNVAFRPRAIRKAVKHTHHTMSFYILMCKKMKVTSSRFQSLTFHFLLHVISFEVVITPLLTITRLILSHTDVCVRVCVDVQAFMIVILHINFAHLSQLAHLWWVWWSLICLCFSIFSSSLFPFIFSLAPISLLYPPSHYFRSALPLSLL